MAPNRVVVTGALGYLGTAVSTLLRDRGHQVVGIDNGEHSRVSAIRDVPVYHYDITDTAGLHAALKVLGPDVIVHLAAMAGVEECDEHPYQAFKTNVDATAELADYCFRQGTPLVFASTAGVYGPGTPQPITAHRARNPAHYYAATKMAAEEVLEAMGAEHAPMIALEMTNLYGQYDVDDVTVSKPTVLNFFVDRALEGETLTVHAPGTQKRDFLHVLDAAGAYLAAVEAADGWWGAAMGGRAVIGSGRELSIKGLAELVAELAPRDDVDVEVVENPRPGALYDDFRVDPGPAKEFIGWEPQREIEDVVDELLA